MTTFVLVHGGFHGAWCWRRIVGPLRKGHAVEAVDLPGRGRGGRPELSAYLDTVSGAGAHCRPPVGPGGPNLGGINLQPFGGGKPRPGPGLGVVNALLVEDGE